MAGHVLFIQELDQATMDIKFQLEELGIRVSVYSNPLQAINFARGSPPDLVVLEILTRPIGGYEIASAISGGKYDFKAPVLFYTEFYRDERARREITQKYGAIHYFVKPFQKDPLRKAILSLLEEKGRSSKGAPEPPLADRPQQLI